MKNKLLFEQLNPGMEKVISECLADAVSKARHHFPSLQALILYGSFSTGDFSLMKKKDNTWFFFSDFDLIAVMPEKHLLKHRLSKIKLSWDLIHNAKADVVLESESTLFRAAHIMEYHNVFHCGQLLWGKDIFSGLTAETCLTISRGQGLRLLFNRLWGILEAIDGCPDMLSHRLKKGLLACLHGDLILRGRHEASIVRLLAMTRDGRMKNLPKTISHSVIGKIENELLGNPHSLPGITPDMMPMTLKSILHYLGVFFEVTPNMAMDWNVFLPQLVRKKWNGYPFVLNYLSFLYRTIIQKNRRPPLSVRPLVSPPCLRIWAGWVALAVAITEKNNEYLKLYNLLMGWFPGFCPAESVKDAITHNPTWQQQVPVTTRI